MDIASLIGLTHYKNKDGILVIEAPTVQKASESIVEILGKYSDSKTALFLSGGTTPKKLYEHFAVQKNLKVGAVGMIDERFGEKDHKNSNEFMIKNTGLLKYFDEQNVRFYPILQKDESLENTALQHDEALRFVFKYFPKSVGILGIGVDGHTAGIPANPGIVRQMVEDQSSLVSYYELEGYGKRITLNFNAIGVMDLIIILVLGQEKREALKMMFAESSVEDIPAKFYLKPEIAAKTILITDQIV
jgi:6-phosphogluconolactonase/glucosamine-6-phosphate isomerase/deaminase